VEFYNKEVNFSSAFLFLRICIIPVNCFSSGLSTTSGLTDKDIKDLKFGMKEGANYVAISFVQNAADVLRMKSPRGRDRTLSRSAPIGGVSMSFALKSYENQRFSNFP